MINTDDINQDKMTRYIGVYIDYLKRLFIERKHRTTASKKKK